MRYGNWVPISKALVGKLPTNRALSEPEAMLSLAVNYDNGNEVSVAGLATRWGWSRGKVRRFMELVGVEVRYPEDTSGKQNQRGQIVIQIADRSNENNGQIRFIDSKHMGRTKDRLPITEGQIADRSCATITYPNPNPKNVVEKDSDSRPKVPVKEIINHLNEKTGRSYRSGTTKTQSLIKARFREGFTLEDFKAVIDRKAADWLNNHEMALYLRPETLFGPKFEGYLQAAQSQSRTSLDCNLCRYNQSEPCANLSIAGFNPVSCDSFQSMEARA